MRVVLVGNYPAEESRIVGGVQASMYGLTKQLLAEAEIDSILVLGLPTSLVDQIIDRGKTAKMHLVFLDTPRFGSTLAVLQRVRWAWRRANIDKATVVHVHGSGPFQAAFSSLCRMHKVPLVWTMHGIVQKEIADRLRKKVSVADAARWVQFSLSEAIQSRLASRIIVDTRYVREALAPLRERISIIPQGIFLDEFSGRFAGMSSAPRVVSIGVMEERKGHHLLIESFSKVVQRLPQATLTIVGANVRPYYRAQLERQVHSLGLTQNVSLRCDISRQEVLDHLFQSHVFALHSQEESQGIAICEAMAAGLPIVATTVGGIPDVVLDGRTGVLTRFGDTTTFSTEILNFLLDEQRRIRFAAAAKERGHEFGWPEITRKVIAVYREALS